ncbi:diguanylate cyclase [Pacificimonas sp. ICDLI1SI03]
MLCGSLGAAYFGAAVLGILLTRNLGGIATIWPASGVLLATLILSWRGHWPGYLATVAIASVAANMVGGASAPVAAAYTIANICEGLLAATLLRQEGARHVSVLRIGSLIRLLGASAIAGLLSATLATFLTGGTTGFFLSWMCTVFLGMMITTPLLLALVSLTERGTRADIVRKTASEATLIGLATLAVSIITFGQTSLPILFLPPFAVLAATYRLGPFGAAASVMIVAITGAFLTGEGSGPIQFIGGTEAMRFYFLQFYLLVLLLSAFPIAVLLNARTRLIRKLENANTMLSQAEMIAAVGHWRLNMVQKTLFWSPEVYRIYGLPQGSAVVPNEGLNAFLEEDRIAIEAVLEKSMATGAPFDFEGRIVRPDGSIRIVRSYGQPEFNMKGEATAMFGIFRDITREVQARAQLLEARELAEEATAAALRLANTDELTDLPNRRRTIAALTEAVELAESTGEAMSVAIFDIDRFKAINDTYGHDVGDEIIVHVAQTVARSVREQDLVGRLGGEEFVIILPIADAATARSVAERVRTSIERADKNNAALPSATISVGVATFSPGCDADTLLRRADKALYEAKNSGRNTLRFAA